MLSSSSSSSLSDVQKTHVRDLISLFLTDLPLTKSELIAKAEEFKKAFANECKEADGYLIHFQNCIHNPTKFLRGMKETPAVSIGQVQRYIFNYTHRVLKAAAKKIKMRYSEIPWDRKAMLSAITNGENFNAPFTATSFRYVSESGSMPYALPCEGRVFTARVVPDYEFYRTTVEVELIEQKEFIFPLIRLENIPEFENNEDGAEFDDYMRKLVHDPHTLKIAEDEVIDLLLEQLAEKKIISNPHIHITSGCGTLLTFSHIYKMVNENIISLKDLNKLTYENQEVMSTPFMQSQLKTREDFLKAKEYSIKEIKVISDPFYQDCLHKKIYIYERDFKGLTISQSKNLKSPIIINLLKTRKITLDIAKNMTSSAHSLLSEETYIDLLKKFTMDPYILKKLSERQLRFLKKPSVIDAIQTHPQLFQVFTQDIFIANLFVSKKITLEAVLNRNTNFYINAINLRMIAMENGMPFFINGLRDDPTQIFNYLLEISTRDGISPDEVSYALFKDTIERLKINIKNPNSDLSARLCENFKTALASDIESESKEEGDPNKQYCTLFSRVSAAASEFLIAHEDKRSKLLGSLFEPYDASRNLCEHLEALQLLNPLKVLTIKPAYQDPESGRKRKALSSP